jgi:hypothetical protein
MRNLISISLIFFLASSFAFAGEPAKEKEDGKEFTEKQWLPILPVDFRKGLFRMTFDVSKNHISGFLLIKKTSDTSTSIVFSNEFGICFFYFEFVNGKFLVRSVFPSFDRKALLSLLEQDFRLILFPGSPSGKIKILQNPDTTLRDYKISRDGGTFRYEVINKTKRIKEIRTMHTTFRKTILSPDHYQDEIPSVIMIVHPLQGIRMKITYLSP